MIIWISRICSNFIMYISLQFRKIYFYSSLIISIRLSPKITITYLKKTRLLSNVQDNAYLKIKKLYTTNIKCISSVYNQKPFSLSITTFLKPPGKLVKIILFKINLKTIAAKINIIRTDKFFICFNILQG